MKITRLFYLPQEFMQLNGMIGLALQVRQLTDPGQVYIIPMMPDPGLTQLSPQFADLSAYPAKSRCFSQRVQRLPCQ